MTPTSHLAAHIFHYFLDRNPNEKEINDMLEVGIGHTGYLWTDDRFMGQIIKTKPILLFYTSCHAEQMITHLKFYRPDLLEKFQWMILYTHRLLLHRGKFNLDLIHAIFSKADTIITNPMNPRFEELSTIPLLKYATGHVAKFVPPSVAAFWPVIEYFGEQPVAKAMVKGDSLEKIQSDFSSGKLDCCFEERYGHQLQRLRMREEDCDAKLSSFIEAHLQSHKLFFTTNHPTFTVIAQLMESCLSKLGYEWKIDPLSVPMNAANFTHHFPETAYEWGYYNFNYPIRWPEDRGGSKFYLDAIELIYKKITDPQSVIDNPLTPVEIDIA